LRFYELDLKTKSYSRLLNRDIYFDESRFQPLAVQLAVSPEEDFVYTIFPAGDLFQLVRIPLSGPTGSPQPLAPLSLPAFGLGVGGDGVVYFDQFQRSLEVLRFGEDGRGLRRIAPSARGREMPPVELPDARVLLPGLVSGRSRLLAGKEGEDPVGLLHTDEEAS